MFFKYRSLLSIYALTTALPSPIRSTATRDEYGDVLESIDEYGHPINRANDYGNVNFTQVVEMIVASTTEDEYIIDWGMAKVVSSEAKGIPVAIGVSIAKEAETMGKEIVSQSAYGSFGVPHTLMV